MNKIKLTAFALLSILSFFGSFFGARAEYRVYQYVVVNKVEIKDQQKSSMVTSTLDPVSYISYNGGGQLVNVDLLRTWICPGHTGKKLICESPYGRLPQEVLQ